MADDEVRIKFRSDDSELRQTGQRIQGFGSDVDKQFAQAASGGGIKGMFNSISQIGFGIFGLQQTVMGFKSAFSGLFSENIQFETFETQFKVVLGTAELAKERIEELAEFGRTTPFELPEVVQASLVLEKFTKGALSTGEGLRMVGDVAAGVNTPVNELAIWFGRLYDGLQSGRPVGEAMMRLQELGVVSGDVRSQIEGMQEAGIEGAVVWETFADSLSQYDGMMGELSKTGQGGLSNIADGIGALKRLLMGGLYDAAFKPAVMFLAEFLGSAAVQNGARDLGIAMGVGLAGGVRLVADGIRLVLPPIVEFVKIIDGPILGAIKWLADNIPSIAKGIYEWAQEHRALVSILSPGVGIMLAIVDNWEKIRDLGAKGMDFGLEKARAGFDALKDFVGDVQWLVENRGSLADIVAGDSAPSWMEKAAFWTSQIIIYLDELGPAFDALDDSLSEAFGLLIDGDVMGALDELKNGFADFATAAGVMDEITAAWEGLKVGIDEVNKLIKPAIDIWRPLVEDIFKELKELFPPIVAAVKQDLLPALRELGPVGQTIATALLPVLELLGKLLGVTIVLAGYIFLTMIREFIQALSVAAPAAISILSVAIQIAIPIIEAIAVAIETVAKVLLGFVDMALALIRGDWATAWDEFKGIFTDAWSGLWEIMTIGWGMVVDLITEWIPEIAKIGIDLVKGFFEDGIAMRMVSTVWPWFNSLGGLIVKAIGSLLGTLKQAGIDLVQGLWNGVQEKWTSFIGWLGGLPGEAAGVFTSIWEMKSPSRLMYRIGGHLVEGLQMGVEETWGGFIASIETLADGVTVAFKEGSASWAEALQLGLDTGAHLATDSISDLFGDLYDMIANSNLGDAGKSAASSFVTGLVSEFGKSGSLANQAVLDLMEEIMAGAAGAFGEAAGSGAGLVPDYVGGGAVDNFDYDKGERLLDTYRNASSTNRAGEITNSVDIQSIFSAVAQGWIAASQLSPDELRQVAGHFDRWGSGQHSNPNIQIVIDTLNAGTVGEAVSAANNLGYAVTTAIAANGF